MIGQTKVVRDCGLSLLEIEQKWILIRRDSDLGVGIIVEEELHMGYVQGPDFGAPADAESQAEWPNRLPTEVLWEANRESEWCVGPHCWLTLLATDALSIFRGDGSIEYQLQEAAEREGPETVTDLARHLETISYWISQFHTDPFATDTTPLQLEGLEVVDGLHRLVAAVFVGLSDLPVDSLPSNDI